MVDIGRLLYRDDLPHAHHQSLHFSWRQGLMFLAKWRENSEIDALRNKKRKQNIYTHTFLFIQPSNPAVKKHTHFTCQVK